MNPRTPSDLESPDGSGLAARNGGRVGLAALVAILLLGLGLRRRLRLGRAGAGLRRRSAYAAIAANLEARRGLHRRAPAATQPSSNYSPGLPLLVAGIYEVTGGVDERLARIVLALIGSLAVLFTYLLGRRLGLGLRPGGRDAGVVAGLIGAAAVAIYPALLEYQGMLMSEPLAATLLSGGGAGDALGRGTGRAASARWWRWPGCAARRARAWSAPSTWPSRSARAARPRSARRCPLRARGAKRRPRRRLAALAAGGGARLGGIVVVVVPWTVRNAVALDRFVPISTGGGQVLFAGTYLPSDGDPEKVGAEVRRPNTRSCSRRRRVERLRLEQILARARRAAAIPELETDQALSRMGREQLWDDVTEEPLEYAGFVATKVGRIWSHGPRDVMREPALGGAALGAGRLRPARPRRAAWRRRWEALVIGAVFLAITAVSALLVASPRRVLVMCRWSPPCAGVIGAGAACASDFGPTRRGRSSGCARIA